jgi:cysteine desulfurase
LLRDLFEKRLTENIPGLLINGRGSDRVYSHSNVYFPDHAGMSLMINLDRMGIAVSTGSACSSGSSNPSPVLRAMGLSEKRIKNSLRFSLGHQTTKADILKTTDALITITAAQR